MPNAFAFSGSTYRRVGQTHPNEEKNIDEVNLEDNAPQLGQETIPSEETHNYDFAAIARLILLLASLFAIAVIAGLAARYDTPKPSHTNIEPPYRYDKVEPRVRRCGHTASEARSHGCIFSPVSFAWLPPSCVDAELDAEIRTHPDWVLYADLNKTRVKSETEWAADNSKTWLTNRAHMLHCVFSWRRMHRDLVAGRELHTGLGMAHTKHCANIIMWKRDPEEIVTGARVIYPGC
nr:uncharacterized protein CTRU02_09722 [Colletotrichum truncatum]KAF6788404.1 hypothetical protein CTRU02_09722 [Colletotrichum truncatum]